MITSTGSHQGRRPHVRRTAVRIAALAAAAGLMASGCASNSSSTSAASARPAGSHHLSVGVFEIAQVSLFDTIVSRFEAQMRHDLPGWQLTFQVENAQGSPTLTNTIARNLASSNDDMFAVIGTSAVIALDNLVKTRPIIALAMSDPVGAKVAASLGKPGGNVTGSTDFVNPSLILPELLKVKPSAQRIGTIYDPSEQNMQVWMKDLRTAAAAAGVKVVAATIATTANIPAAARSLVGRCDAILVGPDGEVFTGLADIGAIALTNRMPFYTIGGDVTTKGMLGSFGPDYGVVGTLAGKVAAQVAKGTPPGDVPFAQPQGVEAHWSTTTANSLHVTVPRA